MISSLRLQVARRGAVPLLLRRGSSRLPPCCATCNYTRREATRRDDGWFRRRVRASELHVMPGSRRADVEGVDCCGKSHDGTQRSPEFDRLTKMSGRSRTPVLRPPKRWHPHHDSCEFDYKKATVQDSMHPTRPQKTIRPTLQIRRQIHHPRACILIRRCYRLAQ